VAQVSLYRKYRSQTFGELIGQEHVVRALQNAINQDRISHAYLFVGPRGTGKTSTARLLAKALNCENGPSATPDPDSDICKSIAAGSCVDVIELDAASESGVDNVRETIVEAVEYRPMECRYKIFIIDEVHDLSAKAFDALLKTIEEPPEHIVFILATTELHKVPPTIRSRCQKYEFHRATVQNLAAVMERVLHEEGRQAEPSALAAIARMADGGYRDALTLLEQALVTSPGVITLEEVYEQLGLVPEELTDDILIAIADGNVQEIMVQLDEVARRGRDPRALLDSLMYRLADLTRISFDVDVSSFDASRTAALHALAMRIGRDRLVGFRASIAEAAKDIRDISLPRLWLEAELLRISQPKATAPPAPAQEPAKAKPRPVEPPVAAKVVSAPEAPPAEVVPASEPEAKPNDLGVWGRWLDSLGGKTPFPLKFADSSVISDDGKSLVIGVRHRSTIQWLEEDPRRQAFIRKSLEDLSGKAVNVRYEHLKAVSASLNNGAVELPAEGEQLRDLVNEISKGA
jgi:DNA polymerase-3 subunit gamma/tau